jgi:hypothetical protein
MIHHVTFNFELYNTGNREIDAKDTGKRQNRDIL